MDWLQRNKDFAIWVGGFIGVVLVALIVNSCVHSMDPGQEMKVLNGTATRVKRIQVPPPGVSPKLRRQRDEIDAALARDAAIIGDVRPEDELTLTENAQPALMAYMAYAQSCSATSADGLPVFQSNRNAVPSARMARSSLTDTTAPCLVRNFRNSSVVR